MTVTNGGLMIDLAPLKGIAVDAARRRARADAGVTWGELDRATQAHGLALTGGMVSSTGIAGLTLGGGLGFLMGRHELTADNLLSASVVTADGRLLVTSAGEHPDLFWGLRGGGGNFGVVTSFEYELHGAVTRVPVDATAVPHREAGYNFLITSVWTDPAASEENVEWTRAAFAALELFTSERQYVNYVAADEPARIAFGPNYDRLVRVKDTYDPDNVFHLNQNIRPSVSN